MGRKSQLKALGQEINLRIKFAKTRVKNEFRAGKLYGQGLKLMRKLAPMETHIDAGKCSHCTPRFKLMKNDPDILKLPAGSDRAATEIILNKPELRRALKEIIECPYYKKGERQ